jgi:hypothetical protein
MRLKHIEIPLRFLQALPDGIKSILRHIKEFLVVEQLYCTKHHSLITNSVHSHGKTWSRRSS